MLSYCGYHPISALLLKFLPDFSEVQLPGFGGNLFGLFRCISWHV